MCNAFRASSEKLKGMMMKKPFNINTIQTARFFLHFLAQFLHSQVYAKDIAADTDTN